METNPAALSLTSYPTAGAALSADSAGMCPLGQADKGQAAAGLAGAQAPTGCQGVDATTDGLWDGAGGADTVQQA